MVNFNISEAIISVDPIKQEFIEDCQSFYFNLLTAHKINLRFLPVIYGNDSIVDAFNTMYKLWGIK